MAKRMIMVGIDGCNRDILYDLIDKGDAPFFRKLADNGTVVRNAVTMYPSTTGSCCSTLYTGCWYRNHGVLNNEWMDRFQSPPAGRSYIAGLKYALAAMDRKLFGLPNILLPNVNKGGSFNNDLRRSTIYEEFTKAGKKSYTYFHYIGKGATKWVRPTRMDMIRFGLCEQYHRPFQTYEKFMVSRALKDCAREMPDLLSIYFGCNDGHSHLHGVPAQREYLRDFIDGELARLAAGLEKMAPGDEFFWGITADHGQSNVDESDKDKSVWHTDFHPILKESGYENIMQTMSDAELEPADAAISLGNGAMISFYLKNKKTKDWKNNPDFETEIVPLLNNLLRASDKLGPYKDWKFPGYVDFLLARKSFEEPYRVYWNKAPYDGPGKLLSVEEYFAEPRGEHVKPVERINGLSSPRGADVILNLDYGKKYNVNEESGFHPGQHGSLLPDDSYVPMIFSGPGLKKGEIAEAFTIDYSPTCASVLGVQMPEADGGILPIFR